MHFQIQIAVWGKPYIRIMNDVAVPALLAPRNLPHIAQTHDCSVIFVTAEADIETIRETSGYREMQALCRVEILPTRIDSSQTVYQNLSRAHHLGAMKSASERARAIVLPPDAIVSDGALAALTDAAERGKRAVMCCGPRLLQEAALPALRARTSGANFTARELVAFMLEHLHPEMQRYFFDSTDFSTFPSMCCWSVGDKGFLMRCFHLHPLMVDYSSVKGLHALAASTIDGEFIGTAIGKWDDIEIVTDSDDLFIVSLSGRDAWYSESSHKQGSIAELQKTAFHIIVNPLHRMFFTKGIKIHTNDLDEEWDNLEEETGLLAFDVLKAPLPPAAIARQKRGALSRWFGR
jgi:hypothetical protein